MIRLNAAQRVQSIPECISPYCTDTDQLVMASRYRIIVCTCSTAGQLYSLGLRAGHISHVFVDEVCEIIMVSWLCKCGQIGVSFNTVDINWPYTRSLKW